MRRIVLLLCALALALAACTAQPADATTAETTTIQTATTEIISTETTTEASTTEKASPEAAMTKPGNSNPAWAYYSIFLEFCRGTPNSDLQYIGLDLSDCSLRAGDREELAALVGGYCERNGLELLLGTQAELKTQGYLEPGKNDGFFPGGRFYWFTDEKLTGKKLEATIMWAGPLLSAPFGVSFTAILRDGAWQAERKPRAEQMVYKPAIYLYPTRPTQVDVTLTLRSSYFTRTIPAYNTGWHVLAQPNGQLTNLADGKTYPYLFWEAMERDPWPEAKEGFVVPRGDLEGFFREKLAYMGLIPAEYEEFIEFWLPKLQENAYSLICFTGEEYTARYPLEVNPAPDSLLRVFMIARPATGRESIAAQRLEPFTRKGFAVIEWGGTLLG